MPEQPMSTPMIRALRIAAMPFPMRPRNANVLRATWRALESRGMVAGPPWQATDAGREWLRINRGSNPDQHVAAPAHDARNVCRYCRGLIDTPSPGSHAYRHVHAA